MDKPGQKLFEEKPSLGIVDGENNASLLAEVSNRYTQDAIYYIDKSGNFIYLNDAACAFFCQTENELLEKRVQQFITDFKQSSDWLFFWSQVQAGDISRLQINYEIEGLGLKPADVSFTYIQLANTEFIACFAKDAREAFKLQHELALYQQLLSATSELVAYVNANGVFQLVNDTFLDFLQCQEKELLDTHLGSIFEKELYELHIKPRFNLALKGRDCKHQYWISSAFGRRCLEVVYSPYKDDCGRVGGVVINARDITERQLSEQEKVLASKVFENAAEAIMVEDDKQRIVSVNPAFCEITGYQKNEVVGFSSMLLAADRKPGGILRRMWRSLHNDGAWRGELWRMRKDGSTFPAWVSIVAVRDGERDRVTKYISQFVDLTQKKRSEGKLRRQVYTDMLTGVASRQGFEQAVETLVSKGQPGVVLYLDLDNLKSITDTLGFSFSSSLLQEAAIRILSCVDHQDVVARYDGEKFAVLLKNSESIQQHSNICLHIIDRLSETYRLNSKRFNLICHIGISTFPRDAGSCAELVRKADMAMCHTKGKTRTSFMRYTNDMETDLENQALLEVELVKGLKNGEFCLAYQPIVNPEQESPVSLEVLLRWRHPERGLITPGEFFSAAEDAGLIDDIGDWVVDQALGQYQTWLRQGYELGRLSLNVSRVQLEGMSFFQSLIKALQKYQLKPNQLILEVTENFILDATQELIQQFDRWQELGVQIALDDFGSGYSSLSYLRVFPIDIIKLDRSFIKDIEGSKVDRAFVETVISLAQKLDLEVVAEGVEVASHQAKLISLGCNFIQGYFVAKPKLANEFEAWLNAQMVEVES